MDIVSLIVIGFYTLIYVFVFIYQNNQIKSQKSLIDSMKSFTEMFDVNQFRKFQEMKEETLMGEVSLILKNDKKLQELLNNRTSDLLKIIKEENDKKMKDQMWQLTGLTIQALHHLPKEERNEFIKTNLPDCNFLFPLLEDLDKNEMGKE
ncbi:MAG: hypothetical protein ACI9Y7_002922 [Dokdonia sp.]|jgi:hypothetical protein